VPCVSPKSPIDSFAKETPSTCLPAASGSLLSACSGLMPRKL
jgi:hypothetical protein